MSRGLTAANVTQTTEDVLRPVIFVKLEFSDGTQYLHDSIGTITWGSNDWLGLCAFGGIGPMSEGATTTPYQIQLSLSGIDDTLLNEALVENVYGRAVTVYIGFQLESGALTTDPDAIWIGTMQNMLAVPGSEEGIALNCESRLSIFEKSYGKLQTDAQQQADHTGDTYFSFVPQMADQRLVWGGDGVTTRGGGRLEDDDPDFDPTDTR